MTTESLRDIALRLAKELSLQNVLRFDYEGYELSQEELETLVRLAMAEGMERAAFAVLDSGGDNADYHATAIRKMKEEL